MNKKNVTPHNDKGKRHGFWESYWLNGSRAYKRFYNNGKRVGYSESYWNKELSHKTYHI